jgi:cell division transport system permease protein
MIRRYFRLHAANLSAALARIVRQPVGTGLTILVIAIALALPAGLKVAVDNLTRLSGNWERIADITLYLQLDTNEDDARQLAATIGEQPNVAATTFISRAQALQDFRARSGFGEALDSLSENPLPHTIVVQPGDATDSGLLTLAEALTEIEGIERVQLDTEWVARLQGMLQLFDRLVDIATLLLAAAVVLVIGNTIRLETNSRSVEIEVMKLVGGTDGFIRRPFLYLGLCYGLLGSAIAGLLIAAALWLLSGPVADLAQLYASRFDLSGLGFVDLLQLIGGGSLLGWAGAWLAAARHLRAIEPS